MTSMFARPSATQNGRRTLAASRLDAARSSLASCQACLHRCAVDRQRGPAGMCGAGGTPNIFSAQTEVGDELELIPTFAIALAGCSMRCTFCVTGDESWHPHRGSALELAGLAERAARVLASGAANSIQILGGEPTIYLPWLVQFAALLPDDARLILKTNGLSTAPARELLDGLFDVWLVDFKFGQDRCARALARTPGYRAALEETLLWADPRADLIVRHLLMPGHVECCWKPIAEWLARHLPAVKVSLRFGYWPAWQAKAVPGMFRPITEAEQQHATRIAAAFDLNLIP